MHPRTKRQKEVLDCVTRYIDGHGHGPSYQQIALILGLSSRGGIQRHIEALERQGHLVRKRENGTFGIYLPSREVQTDSVATVEMLETVEEGGSFVESGRRMLPVPRFMIEPLSQEDVLAYRVPDDSMIDRHICEDDIVLLERRSYGRRGQAVLALANDTHWLFGLYYQLGSETEIRPANPEREPVVFPADEIVVVGVFRAAMRPPEARV